MRGGQMLARVFVAAALVAAREARGEEKAEQPTLRPGVFLEADRPVRYRYAEKVTFRFENRDSSTAWGATKHVESNWELALRRGDASTDGAFVLEVQRVHGWSRTDGEKSPGLKERFDAHDSFDWDGAPFVRNLLVLKTTLTLAPTGEVSALAGGGMHLGEMTDTEPTTLEAEESGRAVLARFLPALPAVAVRRGGTFDFLCRPTVILVRECHRQFSSFPVTYKVERFEGDAAHVSVAAKGSKQFSRKRSAVVERNHFSMADMDRHELVGWSVKGVAVVDLATGLPRRRELVEHFHTFGWTASRMVGVTDVESIEQWADVTGVLEQVVEPGKTPDKVK
jgi:hypothetical protein